MNSKKHRIIMVDDSAEMRELFEIRLNEWFNIETFKSASHLLDNIERITPGLFVIDWMMPDMDGIALTIELRKKQWLELVPIAFYTAIEPSVDNMQKAFNAGAQAFISKSQSTSFLLAHLNTLLDSYERLSSYLLHREIMLSALKNDMANLCTGVITGVEVLSMNPVFKKQSLDKQTDSILEAAKNLRILFEDLNEVLITDNVDCNKIFEHTHISVIIENLKNYLKNIMRRVEFNFPDTLEIYCCRNAIERCLYYMVRFLNKHIPSGEPVAIEVFTERNETVFSVSVKGSYCEILKNSVSAIERVVNATSEKDLLFIQFIKNSLQLHRTDFSIIEAENRTSVRFSLPQRGSSNQ